MLSLGTNLWSRKPIAGVAGVPLHDFLVDFMTEMLDPRVALARSADGATRLGSDGNLKTEFIDVPRYDYDYETPGAPVLRGLLIETTVDNQALWCRDFTNAAWTKSNMATAKDQIGIDGVAASASKLTASAANATALQSITDASNVSRTFSIYVKRLSGSGNIDLTLDNGTTWTTVTVTSSWTRVKVTQTLINPTVGIRIVTSGDVIAVDYAQEEERGSMTSPILTTTAIVTRQVDIGTITGVNFSDWFIAGPGTLYVKFMLPTANLNSTRAICAINDGTNNEAFNMLADAGSGTPRAQVRDGNVDQCSLASGALSVRTAYKYAMSWDVGDFDANLNGSPTSHDSGGTLPTVTQMLLGRFSTGSSTGNLWIQEIKYWSQKLSIAQLDEVCS